MDWFELTRCWTGTIDCILIFFFSCCCFSSFYERTTTEEQAATQQQQQQEWEGLEFWLCEGGRAECCSLAFPFFSSSSFLVTTFSRSIRGRVGGGGVVVGGIEEVKHDNFPARSNALVTLQSLHKEKRSFPFFFSF